MEHGLNEIKVADLGRCPALEDVDDDDGALPDVGKPNGSDGCSTPGGDAASAAGGHPQAAGKKKKHWASDIACTNAENEYRAKNQTLHELMSRSHQEMNAGILEFEREGSPIYSSYVSLVKSRKDALELVLATGPSATADLENYISRFAFESSGDTASIAGSGSSGTPESKRLRVGPSATYEMLVTYEALNERSAEFFACSSEDELKDLKNSLSKKRAVLNDLVSACKVVLKNLYSARINQRKDALKLEAANAKAKALARAPASALPQPQPADMQDMALFDMDSISATQIDRLTASELKAPAAGFDKPFIAPFVLSVELKDLANESLSKFKSMFHGSSIAREKGRGAVKVPSPVAATKLVQALVTDSVAQNALWTCFDADATRIGNAMYPAAFGLEPHKRYQIGFETNALPAMRFSLTGTRQVALP